MSRRAWAWALALTAVVWLVAAAVVLTWDRTDHWEIP